MNGRQLVVALTTIVLLAPTAVTPALGADEPAVQFDDQVALDSVTIARATLPEGGFVAVYTAVDDRPAALRGSSGYLSAGTHEAVEITLEKPLNRSRRLVAVIHRDTNDDRTFGFDRDGHGDDSPYVSANEWVRDVAAVSVPVADSAVVSVGTPSPRVVTDVVPSRTPGVVMVTAVVESTVVLTVERTRIVERTPSSGQPGFGLLAATAALLVTVLLRRRRRHR